jgi:hypothetical protein
MKVLQTSALATWLRRPEKKLKENKLETGQIHAEY